MKTKIPKENEIEYITLDELFDILKKEYTKI